MVSPMMTRRVQRGFSLIELMIAMVLGLVLTLGVTQVYLSSSETYRLTDGLARIQENVRFANSFLGRAIQGAGNDGCMLDNIGAGVQELRRLPSGPPIPNNVAIVGWEHSSTSPGDSLDLSDDLADDGSNWSNQPGTPMPANATTPDNFVEGTDFFVIQGKYPATLNGNQIGPGAGTGNNIPIVDQSGANASTGLPQGSIVEVVSPDCDASFRFIKGNNASAVNVAVQGNGNVPGANIANPNVNSPNSRLMTYRTTLYYIGESADTGEDGKVETALFRQSLENVNTTPEPEELIAGVENMQVLYGIGNRNGATRYVTADDASLTSWQDVVSVRVGLLMRSHDRVRGEPEERVFNLLGTEATTPEDERVRVVMNKTFALRNRLQ